MMTGRHRKKEIKGSIIDSIITDIERARLFVLARQSFGSWYKNWPWLILGVLLDVLFLVGASVTLTLVQLALFEHLEAIMTLAGEATGGLFNVLNETATVTTGVAGLGQSLDFQYHLNVIFKYLGLMIVSIFILWCIFQGLSWYCAQRMARGKARQPLLLFWKNFALQSVPFYAVSILWMFLSIRLLFSVKMMNPSAGDELINFLFVVLMALTWYFGSLCYTMSGRSPYANFKQCFIYGFKRFPKTIQSFGFIVVLFLLIDLFFRIPFIREDPVIMVVLGMLIFMPSIVYARILLFRTTDEYWQEPHVRHKPAKKK